MKRSDLNRRDFNRLSMAALGGVVAGTTIGCGGGNEGGGGGGTTTTGSTTGSGTKEAGDDVSLLLSEPHVCRGLNACKGQGAGKENACAGQGVCATAEHHDCHTMNACKGQGGCGEHPGENTCKGEGKCQVPLMDEAWTTARAAFEKAMAARGKEAGDAPAKPKANAEGDKPAEGEEKASGEEKKPAEAGEAKKETEGE